MDTFADAVHDLHVETDVGVECASVEALDEQFVVLIRHIPEQLKPHVLKNSNKKYEKILTSSFLTLWYFKTSLQ